MASKTDENLIADARKAYERALEAERVNRENWISDVRFARLGEQWPENIRHQREQEGRPCLTINRLPAFIRQVTNDARQNSPAIKFHPVGDGADQATALILDGVVRNIEYTSHADVAYDNALDNAVTGGFGYFRISTDYASDDTFDQDIKIEAIKNPLTVYGDPMDMGSDSSDWNECFVTELWDKAAFEKRWPDAETVDFDADSHDTANWFSDDKIRVAEWWTREEVPVTLLLLSTGAVMREEDYLKHKEFLDLDNVTVVDQRQSTTKKVTQRIITGAEILETNEWPGKYIPIVPVYGDEVVVDGERHLLSLVRFAKDPQQMVNYWRTTSTELVALAPKAPFIGAVGQFATDATKWATANTQTHQYIEYDPVDVNGTPAPPPQRQPFAGVPAGALQEAINASDDMKSIMGLYDASLGAVSNETSGRAILARQREGDVSTFNFTDNLSRAIRHAGRILADLIPKVYNTPRIMRIIHEDGTNESVAVNGAQIDPQQVQQQLNERQQEMRNIGRVFDLTAGKYDVTCEAGPSFTTKREEAASQIMEFIRVYPNAAPIVGDILARNMDWPGAMEISERLKQMLPPQLQGQDPQAVAAQQQIQQLVQALEQMQKQLADKSQENAIDARKLDIDAFNAETNRIKAMGGALTPEAVQALVVDTLRLVLGSPDVLPAPTAQPVLGPQPDAEQLPAGMPGVAPGAITDNAAAGPTAG
jgi:hypothetical protein